MSRATQSSRPGAPGDGVPSDQPGSLFDRSRWARERRSRYPVDRLSRALGDVCITAVDPLEIAAILEAQGFTDDVSREYYRCDDVFDLAERLWHRTPAVANPVPEVVDDRPGSVYDLLHGVIFALNGLFFSIGLRAASEPATIVALVIALLLSWALGQAVSLLWFRIEGRNGDRGGRTVLRRSLQLVLAGGLGVGWLLNETGLPPSVTLMAVGQVYLVIAATALLLYRKELWFFLSLVPALAAVVMNWLTPWLMNTERVVDVVVATVILTVVEAAWLVRPLGRGRHRVWAQWGDIGSALQMACYGVLGAVLLSHSALSTLVSGSARGPRGLDLSVMPLVLTIGVAEWQLRGYRHLSRQVLGLTDDLARFGIVAWRFLLRSFLRYWTVLAGFSIALWLFLHQRQGMVSVENTVVSLAYVVLGGALFLNLVLIAHARVDLALRPMIAAVVLYGVVLVVQSTIHVHPEVLAGAYFALCLGLLLSLLLTTRTVVRQALVHL